MSVDYGEAASDENRNALRMRLAPAGLPEDSIQGVNRLSEFPHPACAELHEKRVRQHEKRSKQVLARVSEEVDQLKVDKARLLAEKEAADARIKALTAELDQQKFLLEKAKSKQKTLTEKRLLEFVDQMSDEMLDKSQASRKETIHKLVDPSVLKDRGLVPTVADKFGVSKQSLYHVNEGYDQRGEESEELTKFIQDWLTDPEFSWECAGKAEVVTLFKKDEKDQVKKKVQKRVLFRDLTEIHPIYQRRVDDKWKCHLSTFQRAVAKAKWFVKIRQHMLECCVCKPHQNYALMLQSMHQHASFLPTDPDALFREYTKDQFETHLCDTGTIHEGYSYDKLPDVIRFKRWQLTPVPVGKTKKTPEADDENVDATNKRKKSKVVTEEVIYVNKLRPVDCYLPADAFVEELIDSFVYVREHAYRADHQHCCVRKQRKELKYTSCTIQMDFAQNWLIGFGEGGEIQSVFFNKDGITIHPVVLHLTDEHGNSFTESLCYVSDDRTHDAGAIFMIIELVCKHIRDKYPHIKMVHYWTDSPSSQYRNISIFSLVCRHKELFGLRATWNYFEANHGKGPCDGVGAAAKRKADMKVKQGNDVYSAALFVKHCNDGAGSVKYVEIPLKDSFAARSRLPFLVSPEKVEGSMHVHSVAVAEDGWICTRETSCFEKCCWDDENNEPVFNGMCQSATSKVKSWWRKFQLFDEETLDDLRKQEIEHYGLIVDAIAKAKLQAFEISKKRAIAVARKRGEPIPAWVTDPSAVPSVADALAGPSVDCARQYADAADAAAAIAEEEDAPAAEEGEAAAEGQGTAEEAPAAVQDQAPVELPTVRLEHFDRGTYVAAIWQDRWYIAQVISEQIGSPGNPSYNLKFTMEGFIEEFIFRDNNYVARARGAEAIMRLTWPHLEDTAQVEVKDILCPVSRLNGTELSASGTGKHSRSGRSLMYISKSEFEAIHGLYLSRLHFKPPLPPTAVRRRIRRK